MNTKYQIKLPNAKRNVTNEIPPAAPKAPAKNPDVNPYSQTFKKFLGSSNLMSSNKFVIN